MSGQHRTVWKSQDGNVEISANFEWPNRDEKITGLLAAGLIDQAEADRLRSLTKDSDNV